MFLQFLVIMFTVVVIRVLLAVSRCTLICTDWPLTMNTLVQLFLKLFWRVVSVGVSGVLFLRVSLGSHNEHLHGNLLRLALHDELLGCDCGESAGHVDILLATFVTVIVENNLITVTPRMKSISQTHIEHSEPWAQTNSPRR
jgi:hypothetical protein